MTWESICTFTPSRGVSWSLKLVFYDFRYHLKYSKCLWVAKWWPLWYDLIYILIYIVQENCKRCPFRCGINRIKQRYAIFWCVSFKGTFLTSVPNQLISILAVIQFFFLPCFIDNSNRHWLLKVKQNYLEGAGTVCLTEGLEEELSSPRWTRQVMTLDSFAPPFLCSSLTWIPSPSIPLFPVFIAWGDVCCIVWDFDAFGGM